MQLTAWSFYVSKSVVSNIIRETCGIIWNELSSIYLKPPTTIEWEEKGREFYERWNLPNCIGAMDGKHISVQAPKKSGSKYFNYKRTFSIVLMAICDANYSFTLVNVGAFGSQSDGAVFKESAFGKAMENNQLDIPADTVLPGIDISFPMFFAADEAFPLKRYIMRPFPGNNLTEEQQIFNYRLSRARRIIENSFGILVTRWRVLRTNIIADVSTIERIVCATLCLHNFIKGCELATKLPVTREYSRKFHTYNVDGNLIPGEWRNVGNILNDLGRMGTNNSARDVIDLRNTFAAYLNSPEGKVDWQHQHVRRGKF